MSIGIFGGTFDPVHLGHLAVAENARYCLGLSKVIFVPAMLPPHKRGKDITEASHRLNMLEIACRDNEGFVVSDVELHRQGPSYTVDTMRYYRDLYPEEDLVFIMGLDSLGEFTTWYRYEEILQLCRIAAITRPGFDTDKVWDALPEVVKKCSRIIEVPGLFVSSDEIRRRVGAGEPVRYLVLDSVEEYIRIHRLYQKEHQDIADY